MVMEGLQDKRLSAMASHDDKEADGSLDLLTRLAGPDDDHVLPLPAPCSRGGSRGNAWRRLRGAGAAVGER
jgi:hypothetical protein